MQEDSNVIYLEDYLLNGVNKESACQQLVSLLRLQSFVVVSDPRVPFQDNDNYLDMMEWYFAQPDEKIRQDMRPEFDYQVGVSEKEMPRDHSEFIKTLAPEDRPYPIPPDYKGDTRWRFFRNLGEPPKQTAFPKLNAQNTPVIPVGFEGEWARKMDAWGNKMLDSIYTIAEMLAVGFNIDPADTFVKKLDNGPHLIAPNGVNLTRYPEGTIFNGFHYDFNWGTIHGRSRFPGLRVWPRMGSPFRVRVPEGCLLFQVGKQLEWQTGGYLQAGFHEVANLPETVRAAQEAVRLGRPPIRVSSTVFGHMASDRVLSVLDRFRLLKNLDPTRYSNMLKKYPNITVGKQVEAELEAIGFKKKG